MGKLVDAFNPSTVEGLMCRNTISVSWDGYIYDCDFNQMLDLKVATTGKHIKDFDAAALAERAIVLNPRPPNNSYSHIILYLPFVLERKKANHLFNPADK